MQPRVPRPPHRRYRRACRLLQPRPPRRPACRPLDRMNPAQHRKVLQRRLRLQAASLPAWQDPAPLAARRSRVAHPQHHPTHSEGARLRPRRSRRLAARRRRSAAAEAGAAAAGPRLSERRCGAGLETQAAATGPTDARRHRVVALRAAARAATPTAARRRMAAAAGAKSPSPRTAGHTPTAAAWCLDARRQVGTRGAAGTRPPAGAIAGLRPVLVRQACAAPLGVDLHPAASRTRGRCCSCARGQAQVACHR